MVISQKIEYRDSIWFNIAISGWQPKQLKSLFAFFCVLKQGLMWMAYFDLEHFILLAVPLKCWDYRHAALCLAISRVFKRQAYTRVQCYSQQPKGSAWAGGKLLETAYLTINHLHAMGQHTSCHGATELWTSRSPRSAHFMLHAFYHNKNKWVKKLTAWFNFTKDSLLTQVLAKFCFLLRLY